MKTGKLGNSKRDFSVLAFMHLMGKMLMKTICMIMLLMFSCFVSACDRDEPNTTVVEENDSTNENDGNEDNTNMGAHLTVNDYVRDIVNHPAFQGFGERMLTRDDNSSYYGTRLSDMASLMPYHNNVNPANSVDAVNSLIDDVSAGKTVFYDFYTEEQKRNDPAKRNTGLFFFRGKPDAPFAIVCPGGGWSYVGSLHEGFPLAAELGKKGYNAFVIRYRIGGERIACEDLAAAISYVFNSAAALQVSTDGYSLWGGSAGARMAANLGSYGAVKYGGNDITRPATVVMQYTGHSDYTENDPPTFACIGENDGIASPQTMERRINNLKALGIDTEFHLYPNLGHGFGLGLGASAEGWHLNALTFWEKHIPSVSRAIIPDELEGIPAQYFASANQQGTLVALYYDTYESFGYEQKTQTLRKRAIVYVPYGYSTDKKYDVFYLMHGGWANETMTLGTPENPSAFKNVIDNAIADGKFKPLIIVCPTYNNTSNQDSGDFGLALNLTRNYHNELLNDLIPAVESAYSTYAGSVSPADLTASREHRGFGGFSMGSVATWRTFQYCLDYFRYFLPMSCGTSLDEDNIFAAAKSRRQSDYFVWIITGTQDFAYSYDTNRAEMLRKSPYFTENLNFAYRVKQGYAHDGRASTEYTYNGLLWFGKL